MGQRFCRIHSHVFSFASKQSQMPDFQRQVLKRCKGTGDIKTVKFQVQEYATHLSNARADLLSKAQASAASDIATDISQATDVSP